MTTAQKKLTFAASLNKLLNEVKKEVKNLQIAEEANAAATNVYLYDHTKRKIQDALDDIRLAMENLNCEWHAIDHVLSI